MLKIVLLSAFAIGITMFVIRKVPRLRFYAQRLLQNPIVRTILFRALRRLVQLLIFRRYGEDYDQCDSFKVFSLHFIIPRRWIRGSECDVSKKPSKSSGATSIACAENYDDAGKTWARCNHCFVDNRNTVDTSNIWKF